MVHFSIRSGPEDDEVDALLTPEVARYLCQTVRGTCCMFFFFSKLCRLDCDVEPLSPELLLEKSTGCTRILPDCAIETVH